jgi:enoyl-CoA hydratase/carnithine racemase
MVEKMRYFKKLNHRQKLILTTGQQIEFQEAGDWGLYSTTDTWLINQFLAAIREQRGGLFEITEMEFLNLKKNATPSPSYNEAITPRSLNRVLQELVAAAERVAGNVTAAARKIGHEVSRPVLETGYRPASVKR